MNAVDNNYGSSAGRRLDTCTATTATCGQAHIGAPEGVAGRCRSHSSQIVWGVGIVDTVAHGISGLLVAEIGKRLGAATVLDDGNNQVAGTVVGKGTAVELKMVPTRGGTVDGTLIDQLQIANIGKVGASGLK